MYMSEEEMFDPERLTKVFKLLGFSMKEFFNDDGSLKSLVEDISRPLPFSFADYYYQLTVGLAELPPAERFHDFLQILFFGTENIDPEQAVPRFIYQILMATIRSIE